MADDRERLRRSSKVRVGEQVVFRRPFNGLDLAESMNPLESLGIWKIGESLQQGTIYHIAKCQPIDAGDSPRWDYVIKYGDSDLAKSGLERTIAATSSVAHPNLVPILDGELAGEIGFVVMPFLSGIPMEEQWNEPASRRLPIALWMVRQLCQALDAMHEAGWTHGDIKPSNLIVGNNGHTTLIDLAFSHRGTMPSEASFVGTPQYAAPELLINPSSRTAAADMFASGRLLWEWLTRVSTQRETLLSPICQLVEWMVAEEPSDRPSAAAVVKELLRLEIDTLGDHILPPSDLEEITRAA